MENKRVSDKMEDDATPAFNYYEQVFDLENRIDELKTENERLQENFEILDKGYEEACRQISQLRKIK